MSAPSRSPDDWPRSIPDAVRCILRDYEDYADHDRKKAIVGLATLVAYQALSDAGLVESQARRMLDLGDELIRGLDSSARPPGEEHDAKDERKPDDGVEADIHCTGRTMDDLGDDLHLN